MDECCLTLSKLQTVLEDSSVANVLEKAIRGEKLTYRDGVLLMQSQDIHAIGAVADIVRKRQTNDTVSFVVSYNMNYSNV